MPSIRPVLIVGTGDHAQLAAAVRSRGLGPMLAADVEQAIRLLRNFRVDVVICMGMAMEAVRKISERAPTVVVGDSEPDAWNAGAAGFAATGSAIVAVPELAYRVARGERGIRIA